MSKQHPENSLSDLPSTAVPRLMIMPGEAKRVCYI